MCLLLVVILVVVGIWLLLLNYQPRSVTCTRSEFRWKGEAELSLALRTVFPGHTFIHNHRPQWNLNPVTKRALELDFYCPELKLAFELNGRQHYETVAFFDGTDPVAANRRLAIRQANDRIKALNCDNHGDTLIVIPYNHPHTKITYIMRNPAVLEIIAAVRKKNSNRFSKYNRRTFHNSIPTLTE